jgi:uncharacterized protein (DUF342 family)
VKNSIPFSVIRREMNDRQCLIGGGSDLINKSDGAVGLGEEAKARLHRFFANLKKSTNQLKKLRNRVIQGILSANFSPANGM